jgi:hypothetical protein
MKVTKYEDQEAWFEARRGRISGSSVKDLIVKRGTEMKKGYYQLIADRITIGEDKENKEDAMRRGTRLEPEAIALFVEEMVGEGIPAEDWVQDLVIWEREDNKYISLSPDGYHKDLEQAIEVKCLNSADHIKAYIDQEVPKDYQDQAIQYFVVNEDLQVLHFVMYDPRLTVATFFVLTVKRDEKKVEDYLKQQRNMLASVEAQVTKLTADLF